MTSSRTAFNAKEIGKKSLDMLQALLVYLSWLVQILGLALIFC